MLEKRSIGRGGPRVNPIGLGCMGMSMFYGPPMAEADAINLIHAAIDLGVDHLDTAELYGGNEELLGKALAGGFRARVFLATKFGPTIDPVTKAATVDGSESNMRRAIEQSLARLNTDHVDLYYLHRPDPSRPVEETVGAMAKLVAEGKVRALGLSEVSSENLRRAAAVHPIAAVQTEFSIFTRSVEAKVLPAAREVGATLVAYSPLGRGMLTGALKDQSHLDPSDWRLRGMPRFSGEALTNNIALVEAIEAVAAQKGASAAQVALAWVLARAPDAVTIPGTTKLANLQSNLAAADVALSEDDMAVLNGLAEKVQGTRYNEQGMAMLGTDEG